jgi:hypothetical protein
MLYVNCSTWAHMVAESGILLEAPMQELLTRDEMGATRQVLTARSHRSVSEGVGIKADAIDARAGYVRVWRMSPVGVFRILFWASTPDG